MFCFFCFFKFFTIFSNGLKPPSLIWDLNFKLVWGVSKITSWHLQIWHLVIFDGHVPNDWKPLLNMKVNGQHSKIMRLLLGGIHFLI